MWFGVLIALIVLVIIIKKMFIIVTMREEVIKERLGKYTATLKPGFHFMIPFLDNAAYRREMRERVLDVPSQSCITSDNIQVEVDGLVYIKVMDAYKASYGIENYKQAAVNMAQTTMRSEIGKMSLDDTFTERDALNDKIVREIDTASGSWGIKVLRYELKNISPSANVEDTMEKQMEAERGKRAEVTRSSGQREARIKVSEGERLYAINISEGEKLKKINEAEGKAAEIRLVAQATANGIRRIGEAIEAPGGELAVRTQLLEQFITEYGTILDGANISVLPVDLASIRSVVKAMGDKVIAKGGK
jgi:regulator of protease activity HflC (stomatin/prohibitin superfamily)